jgi:hypothetical protein
VLSDSQFVLLVCPQRRWPEGLDPGTSLLEGSDVQENWATDFGGAVGGESGNEAR